MKKLKIILTKRKISKRMKELSLLTCVKESQLWQTALEEMIRDNGIWFLTNVVYEHYKKHGCKSPFILGNLVVTFEKVETGGIIVTSEVLSSEEKPQIKVFKNDRCNRFKNYLIDLHEYIDISCSDTQEYIDKLV